MFLPATFREWSLQPGQGGETLYHMAVTATVRAGDSGAPVLRARDGRVVGMIVSRFIPANGSASTLAYAAPVEWMTPVLDLAAQTLHDSTPDAEFYLLPASVTD